MLTLSLCALGLLAARAASEDARARDAKALQGTWQAVSGEYSKEKISPKEAGTIRLVYKSMILRALTRGLRYLR